MRFRSISFGTVPPFVKKARGGGGGHWDSNDTCCVSFSVNLRPSLHRLPTMYSKETRSCLVTGIPQGDYGEAGIVVEIDSVHLIILEKKQKNKNTIRLTVFFFERVCRVTGNIFPGNVARGKSFPATDRSFICSLSERILRCLDNIVTITIRF